MIIQPMSHDSISALMIHCSEQTKSLLDELGGFYVDDRGIVSMKVRPLHILIYSI